MRKEEKDKLAEKALSVQKLIEALSNQKLASKPSRDATTEGKHEFWSTQPVNGQIKELGDSTDPSPQLAEDGPIQDRNVQNPTPFALPPQFKWSTLDIDGANDDLSELYTLLNENYVEDTESLFRFDYPPEFLKWALMPPGWSPELHLAVRVTENNRLVAFISAIPCSLVSRNNLMPSSIEVNFLCIHKQLRSKRLAPLLIREITRRANMMDFWHALYTAGTRLPGCLFEAAYWHRPIDFEKLVKVGFAAMPVNKTLAQMQRLYRIKDKLPGHDPVHLRPMQDKDLDQVTALLASQNSKFKLHPMISREEAKHWLMPRNEVVYAFVEDGPDGTIKSMASFYNLPSTVVNNTQNTKIKVAYLFHYCLEKSCSGRLPALINALLKEAAAEGFDVFNCVEIGDNQIFLKDPSLEFGRGDGSLYYYLYNWRICGDALDASDTSVVML